MSYHSYSDTQELMIELANFMRQITFEDVNNSLPQARAKAHKILAQKVKSKFMRNFLVQNIYKDKDGFVYFTLY